MHLTHFLSFRRHESSPYKTPISPPVGARGGGGGGAYYPPGAADSRYLQQTALSQPSYIHSYRDLQAYRPMVGAGRGTVWWGVTSA